MYNPELKIGIEYDGKNWQQDTRRDLKKDKLLKQLGVRLYRIRECYCPHYDTTSNVDFVTMSDCLTLGNGLREAVRKIAGMLQRQYECFSDVEIKLPNDDDVRKKYGQCSRLKKRRIGETKITNHKRLATIVDYTDFHNIVIKIEGYPDLISYNYEQFRRGQEPMNVINFFKNKGV